MISKVEARKNVIEYLQERNRDFQDLDPVTKMGLQRQAEISWGKHAGKVDDLYVLSYEMNWGVETRSIFVTVSATTGEVLYSRGPHGMLEELELPENPMIEKARSLVEDIFKDIFLAGDFSFGEASDTMLLYESYDYNLEFQYDSRYGAMVYGGMYIRLLENDHAYRLNDLLEFFDPEKRPYKEIIKPFKDDGDIDLRAHATLIQSHLMSVLTSKDISWEGDFKQFLSNKQPY